MFHQLIDIDATLYHPYSDTWCYLTRAWLSNLSRSNIVHPVKAAKRTHINGWRHYNQTFDILIPGFHKSRISPTFLLCLKAPPSETDADADTQAQLVDFLQQFEYNEIEPITQEMLAGWNEQVKQQRHQHFYSLAYNC